MYQYHEADPISGVPVAGALESLPLDARRVIQVVRDDRLPGGTKQRALVPFLKTLKEAGYRNFAYATPFAGYAQVALAVAAREVGVNAVIFAEPAPGGQLHENSFLAHQYGAEVIHVPDLGRASALAARFSAQLRGTFEIPLGFNHPLYRVQLEKSLRGVCNEIVRSGECRRVWVPVGSGTLLSTLRRILPASVRLLGIDVRVLSDSDEWLQRLARLENVSVVKAEETFSEPARVRPPLPSNLHYDAKIWQHLLFASERGDVWWNVGP